MLKPSHNYTPPANGGSSQSTLLSSFYYGDLDVVVFGTPSEYTAALMVGLTPDIEGDKANSPEGAMRKLFTATCELLKTYIPKVGTHQRNIHGGGVFDEDLISGEVVEAQKKAHGVVLGGVPIIHGLHK